MNLLIYIAAGIIFLIISLIQKSNERKKTNKNKYSNTRRKNNENKELNNKRASLDSSEEEIFNKLRKNIKDLENITDEVYSSKKNDDVYYSSNNDIKILELQKEYNSKINQINDIKNSSSDILYTNLNKKNNLNTMLSSLDIKNAIIYNAILESRRINYIKKYKS